MKALEQLLQRELSLQVGDILLSETPFEDAKESDFFPFKSVRNFNPDHSALWVDHDHPIAHSVREGYKLPGVRLTSLSDGRYVIFRLNDKALAQRAGEILKGWALASRFYSKELYLESYPKKFWDERQEKDLKNFYENGNNVVPGPATPFAEPRATHDVLDVARKPVLAEMGMEGLRRAIKFASRIGLTSPDGISKGQRCTAVAVAAFQAAILEPIVKPQKNKSFKEYKNKDFLSYADEVLIEGWRETELGKKLILAAKTGDFSTIFPPPFLFDQRYVTPAMIYQVLNKENQVTVVGRFGYFNNKVEITDAQNKTQDFNMNLSRNPR